MAAFPTLSRSPQVSGLQDGLAFDPTIRTELSSGYLQTGNRVAWIPKQLTRTYQGLTSDDQALIDTFQNDTVRFGCDPFYYYDVVDSTCYAMKLVTPVALVLDQVAGIWTAQFAMCQCSPYAVVIDTAGDYGYGAYGDGNYLGT